MLNLRSHIGLYDNTIKVGFMFWESGIADYADIDQINSYSLIQSKDFDSHEDGKKSEKEEKKRKMKPRSVVY